MKIVNGRYILYFYDRSGDYCILYWIILDYCILYQNAVGVLLLIIVYYIIKVE